MGCRDRRSKIHAVLGIAFLVLLSPAVRADTSSAGPIRHSKGYSNPQQPTGFLNIGAGVYEPTDQPGDGFYGTLAVGSEVAPQIDVGAQVSWYHQGTNSGQYQTSYVGPGGIVYQRTVTTDAYDTDLVPLMGILRLRFPMSASFQPYVGGGIGYEWLTVSAPGATYYDPYGYPYTVDVGTTYGGFGGMALAGVNIGVTPTTSFYGEATYNWSTVSADYYDPYYLVTTRESVNMDGAAFQGGLKFRF